MIIAGIIFAVGGGWGAWWAFNQTMPADDFYHLLGPIAIIVAIIGIFLIIFGIRKWWMSD